MKRNISLQFSSLFISLSVSPSASQTPALSLSHSPFLPSLVYSFISFSVKTPLPLSVWQSILLSFLLSVLSPRGSRTSLENLVSVNQCLCMPNAELPVDCIPHDAIYVRAQTRSFHISHTTPLHAHCIDDLFPYAWRREVHVHFGWNFKATATCML